MWISSRALRVLLLLGPCWLLLGSGVSASAAAWVAPLAGDVQVTRPFEPPPTPYGRGHRGVDLAGTPGQAVAAAGAGTVGFAAPLAGRGVVTVLHADGLKTTYEPVTAAVVVGQAVDAGQPIGSLDPGHAGCPVAACLHWGLLRGEVYLDPMLLLGLGPVRLLPSAAVASDRVPGPVPAGGVALKDLAATTGADGLPVVTTAAGLLLGAGVLVSARGRPP